MRIVSTAAGLGALVLLAGCGGGFAEESADTITSAAAEDMKAVKTLRMAGELTSGEQTLQLDLGLDTDGNCGGTVTLADGDDASLEILRVDGSTWMKPSEGFWQTYAGPAADQVVAAVGDKWVVLPEDQAADFASQCDLDEFTSELGSEDAESEVGETSEIDGQEVVMITSETSEGDPLEAAVATDEPHHVLQLEVTDGAEPGTLTFSDFDEDLDLEAPADDDVVDLASLAPGAG